MDPVEPAPVPPVRDFAEDRLEHGHWWRDRITPLTPRDPALIDAFARAQHFAAAGQIASAQALYRHCVAREPRFLAAWFALGQSAAVTAHVAEARDALGRALILASGDRAALALVGPALADVLAHALFAPQDPTLREQLLILLDIPQVDPQPLARVMARLVDHSPDDPDAIARDPLWQALLTRCINVDPALERRLTRMRRDLLVAYAEAASLPHRAARLATLLAVQAFAGEYVWPLDDDEAGLLARPLPALLAALYRPLLGTAPEADLKRLKKDRFSALLVKRTLLDLAAEERLGAALDELPGAIVDDVSAAVRDQYEANPYPRWQAPPVPRPGALRTLVERLPGLDAENLPRFDRILIAGCGTGYEAIGVALGAPQADVTALDLSRASLAHGQRMATELGVANIGFVRGDILDAAALDRCFDCIYATGVLHHMDRPADGLASLVPLLAPGGMIRIGLYSERARAAVRAARDLIASRRWTPADDDIRAFRAKVLAEPATSPLAALRDSPDFFSLSGCRDLCFHAHEHRFTFAMLADLIAGSGLRLAGIEGPAGADRQFAGLFGAAADRLDLGMWDQLEAGDPSLFAGMILVWCQKP